MNKIFLYVPTLELFLTKKIAVNKYNTEYITGELDAVPASCLSSEIEISWEKIVFIGDIRKIWTHGSFFGGSDEELDLSSIFISNNYAPSQLSNSYLAISSGDTIEAALGKLEKSIIDNELVISNSITDFEDRLSDVEFEANEGQNTIEKIYVNNSLLPINNKSVNITIDSSIGGIYVNSSLQQLTNRNAYITIPTKISDLLNDTGYTSNNGTITGIRMNNQSMGASGVIDLGNVVTSIKTINSQSLTGTGDITINSGEENIIDRIYVNNNLQTVNNDKSAYLTFKSINGESIVGSGNISVSGGSGGTGGDVNVIESISVNTLPISPDVNKNVEITIPTKLSDLTNDLKTINKKKTVLVVSNAATIEPYCVNSLGIISSTVTITFDTSYELSGFTADYCIRFSAGNNCNIILPSGCKYSNGAIPNYAEGHDYEINISDNLVVVGEFY